MANEASYCEAGKKHRATARAVATLLAVCEMLTDPEIKSIDVIRSNSRIRWIDHLNICTTCSKAYNVNIIRERERQSK